MQLSSISIAITSFTGALFSPRSIFTTGVNGAWYDPSDFGTMFQDAAGTTPVTAVGQPVGLMLDKSKGLVLGPELVAPINFTSGWASSGATVTFGSASTFTSSGVANIFRAYFTIGSWYKMVFKATFTGGIALYNSNTATNPIGPSSVVSGTEYTFYFFAAATQLNIRTTSASTVTVSNISVRELPGNHAFNPSGNSANFPELSARYNLLTKTEDFSDAVWLKKNSGSGALPTVSADAGLSPIGTQTADLITINRSTTTGLSFLTQLTTDDGAQKSRILYVKAFSASDVGKVLDTWTFDGTVANGFAITLTADWQKVILPNVTVAAGASKELFSFGYLDSGSLSPNTGEIKFYIWGADLRVANDALNQPAYQRVNTATDYDTVGFKPYLSFNGVNQWLQTNSIDFTYGDKMFVSAGVRKLSDAARGMLLEMSTVATNPGTFYFAAPDIGGANNYGMFLNGNDYYQPTSFAAPITNVVSVLFNRAGGTLAEKIIPRINGAVNQTNGGSASTTGNFGNYPLYIGARSGTSLWFNGRLYGLVVAGKQVSASEIASTEAWLNQKTGAY